MRSVRTLIVLAVSVLVVGCLPTTPTEAGVGVLLLGLCCLLSGWSVSVKLYQIEGKKPAAWIFLGVTTLIGGGFIALGARWLGWWGQ
jgi:hypothetical protein